MSALSIQVKDLRQELTVAKELHAEQVSAFETQITELTEAKAGFEAKIQELDSELTSAKTDLEAADLKIAELDGQVEAKEAELEELKAEIAKAKAALEDPAFAAAGNAGDQPGDEGTQSDEPIVSLEHYRSLRGAEKVAYWAKHKSELLK